MVVSRFLVSRVHVCGPHVCTRQLAMLLVSLGLLCSALPVQADEDALLAAARDTPRLHSLLVAVDGEPVVEGVFQGEGLAAPANIKSLSKSVLAALVGIAIGEGVIESVDQPVVELLGDRVPDNATPGVETITVGQLLSLQAGLQRTSGPFYGAWVSSNDWVSHILTRPFEDEPGGGMLYSSGSSHLLAAALTEASGRSLLALTREWLGEPLNITVPAWPTDPQGIYFGGNDMLLSPYALMHIGELYRHDGRHDGRQVLPEGWVEASWTARAASVYTGDAYGYGRFNLTLDGEDVWYGRGFGGQMLYVVPSLSLTVVMLSDPEPPSSGGHIQRLHRLMTQHILPLVRDRA